MINIAIDGPASSGKGTVARKVAVALDYSYIDSGAMYRAVALFARRRRVPWDDGAALTVLAADLAFAFSWKGEWLQLTVGGEDVTEQLRDEAIGNGASQVSAHPGVRSALLGLQRDLAAKGGVVMDGRDIGSVVLPDAQLKVFLDASVEERATRRTAELRGRGLAADLRKIEAEIVARDHQDRNRPTAPLIQTEDAVYIDTTGRTAEQAAQEIVGRARALMRDGP